MRRTRMVGAVVALGALAGVPALSPTPAPPPAAETEVRAAADIFLEIKGIRGESRE